MTADPASAGHSSGHKGTEYYFCLTRCPERFEKAPNDFLEPRRPREPVAKGTRYTSPMHSDIMRDGPEDCPICSMALETMDIPSADAAPNPELIEFTRRIWIGAALSAPVVALAMAPHVGLGLHDWFGERPATWLELLLATPAVLWCGWPFSQRG